MSEFFQLFLNRYMRPIIDGMGLTYQGQVDKLKYRFSKGVREIMIPTKGGEQTMLCLALRKLNGWLQTISPNKVKPEIRDRVIQYQEECDDVLYEYWTQGQVTNPRKVKKISAGKITAEQQEAIKQLVLTRAKSVPQDCQAKATITLWSALKTHFGCSYKEISEEQFTEALSLAARVPIEGEFIGKDQTEMTTIKAEEQHRYHVQVTIRDNLLGGQISFLGKANTFKAIATGIASDLGYKPVGFTELPDALEKLNARRIH